MYVFYIPIPITFQSCSERFEELQFGEAYSDSKVLQFDSLIVLNGSSEDNSYGAFRLQKSSHVCGHKSFQCRYQDIEMIPIENKITA